MRTGIRLIGTGTAGAIVAAAWVVPNCRTSEGALNGFFALGLALAAAALVAGWSALTPWARAGRWLALGLAGQACALQLMDAGTRIHYQHYRLPTQALADPVLRWVLAGIGLQLLIVAYGLVLHRGEIPGWVRNSRRLALLAAGIAACGCVSAAVSRDPQFWAAETGMAVLIELVSAGNILLFALALPPAGLKPLARRFDRLLGEAPLPERVTLDRFALLAALWTTVLSALLAWFVYQDHPHLADEVVYLYHARYFAAGELVMPPPPVVPAFQVDMIENQPDKWYAVPPMGWPAVLAVGAALGAPWLVNPVLAGHTIRLTCLLLPQECTRS